MMNQQSGKQNKKNGFSADNKSRIAGITRFKTGIKGLDEVLGGGLAEGRSMLITGTTGCGKTVFLNEFIYRGISCFNQNGIFITFEERTDDIIRNVAGFGWDFQTLIDEGRLTIIDISQQKTRVRISGDFDWEVLLERIAYVVEESGAKRVAVDSIGTTFGRFSSSAEQHKVREMFFSLMDRLKNLKVTTLISSEKVGDDKLVSRYGFEEFVSDAAMSLSMHFGQNKVIRNLNIVKLRGLDFRSGSVEFEITTEGVQIFPKIPIYDAVAKTDFSVRKKTGITGLDKALCGGVPQGHMMLTAGNTGTGKTLLGMHFLMEGIKEGQAGVWVALEEPVEQVKKTAEAHNWMMDTCEQQGKLIFVRSELLDVSPDKLLYKIIHAVKETNANRVVVDSVSSLVSSTMDGNKVREFLIQFSIFCKSLGITCFMNYLCADSFGATKEQLLAGLSTNELRLSSIVDGIILVRYVERNQKIQKLLTILKLRGSDHNRDIFKYEIKTGGIEVGDRFKAV